MYQILLTIQIISAVVITGTLFYVFRRKPSQVQKDLILINTGLLISILCYTLEMMATDMGGAVTAVKMGYVGRAIILFSMFFLIVDFSETKLNPSIRTIAAAIQIFNVIAVFTFDKHWLFYSKVEFVDSGLFPHLVKEHGPLYWVFMVTAFAYSIGMIACCVVMAKRNTSERSKKLLRLFSIIIICPTIGYAFHLLNITGGYNSTILGYVFGAFIFTWIFRRYGSFEAVNVAWENALKFMGAGLLVYDRFGNLIYENDMAKEIDISDRIDELYKSREYVFKNEKVYRVEKLKIDDEGGSLGYAYYIDNETDNYNYENMLREEKQRADDANTAKTQFLSSMSHDIRTPMNAILGLTDIAKLHMDDRDKLEDSLNKINTAGKHLIELINEVLDINKIESGKFELYEEDFDIVELTEEIETMSRSLVDAKQHSLSIDTSKVLHPFVHGDRSRLSQVIMNLVSNSVKYTNNGGLIIVNVSEMNSGDKKANYKIIVRDNGIGMSEEYLPTIFDAFTRAQDDTVYKTQGSGLGMAITKQFVELMGGKIEVRSTLGIGTTFEIVIPMEYGDESNRKVNTVSISDLAGKNFSGRRILVVEDNPVNSEIMGELLEMAGIEVECASDGTEAVRAVTNVADDYYDLIFMDVQMPRMNGYDATRAIRDMDRAYAKAVPIIAVTANAFSEDIKQAMDAGMNSYITKPVEYNKLIEVLSLYLELN